MSIHSEWLSLLEISGPFLAETVLETHFPQGLDELEPFKKKLLRQAYDEWREAQDINDPQFSELHRAWTELVLKQGLELDEDDDGDVLKSVNHLATDIKLTLPEYDITIEPDYAVVTAEDKLPSLLIQTFSAGTDLETVSKKDGWAASPVERMVWLCRATKVRLGLLTNGERWMLIDAPDGGVTTYASWYSRLWGQEPITLQVFINLLGIRRFYLDPSQQLPALLDESLRHQDEVTDALGDQVRRAVEVLVQALDKADQDRGRELLREVEPPELYEAGLTVMMRLVFLLSAEERDLLLLGDERYEAYYAVSTLRMQLREQAGLHSEEILSHRRDAWSRLLAIFRAVYGGVEHETLRMPALGGSLFDPDRFPFLEGRGKGSDWRHDPAQPLPIDNRTVLLLLDAIQLFQGRTLSYRALDVEQIGYVYEGLLERTVMPAKDVTLELDATKKSKQPWLTWGELEDAQSGGDKAVAKLLQERTGSSASRVKNDLAKVVSDADKDKMLTACHGDQELRDRLAPYYHFLRIDPWGYPLIYPKGAFMVTMGSDRRETGTHYTPKSLTEAIVKETLEPVVYAGPAEGHERQDWQLKSPAELLDLKICDLAMGSGAFLVQVCRWLSERLLEAWAQTEGQGKSITSNGVVVDQITNQEPLTANIEERSVTARRLISERCLYGVDVNPLAVELAKLSIWLVTLAKGRPFGFLDHNFRHGDSLLGITDLDQLHYLDMKVGKGSGKKLFAQKIDESVREAIELRMELRQRPILDIHDVEVMAHLDQQAREKLELTELVADALVGETLKIGGKKADVTMLSIEAGQAFEGDKDSVEALRQRTQAGLNADLPVGKQNRKALHWCLEFPEVFFGINKGFDAVIGNPPFLGGKKIAGAMGRKYLNNLISVVGGGVKGSADLVAFFFLRASVIVGQDRYFGLIASNSIAEGGTREVGLEQLKNQSFDIYKAYSSEMWPGAANVVTSRVYLRKGPWADNKILNGKIVEYISPYLTHRDNWEPVKLGKNGGIVHQGNVTLGSGFILDQETAEKLIGNDAKYSEVVFPYLGGQEVNRDPQQKANRWVINFWDWSSDKSRSRFPDLFQITEKVVYAERQEMKSMGGASDTFWLHLWNRSELYHQIGRGYHFDQHPIKDWSHKPELKKVIVFARAATKYCCFSIVPNIYVYSDSLCIVSIFSYGLFASLSSDVHCIWAWEHGSKMKQDLRYSHGDIFETFPFSEHVLEGQHVELNKLGEELFAERVRYMNEKSKGMTKFYNDYHDQAVTDPGMTLIRNKQIEVNNAVIKSYGFVDLDLNHGFHQVAYLPEGKNTRFTISEAAREELLYRLAMLNKERHEAKANKNSNIVKLKSQKTTYSRKSPAPALKVAEEQPDLFSSAVEPDVKPKGNQWGSNPVDQICAWLEDNQGKWFSKDIILNGCGAYSSDWEKSIRVLLDDGDVEQQGEGPQARYRAKL